MQRNTFHLNTWLAAPVFRLSAPIQLILLIVLTTLALAPCAVRAQIAGAGSIRGTATDSTGAVISSATVELTNEATHVKLATISNETGAYLFPNIPIGTYDLAVAAPGFKTYVQKGVVLEVGSNIAVNSSLVVGSKEQTIEVQADSLALQTEDPTFKQTIDQNAVTEMPLNGRQMTALITLSGGSNVAPGADFVGNKDSYAAISVSIAGGGGNTTLWRLDGGDNQDYMGNANLPFPFPDAVSQFSVESTVLGAQDGGHIGGMVNVVTKSGTNQFHGEAFEFIRNDIINSNNFFSGAKDRLHQHQFGGIFGGPIKRDKLFVFAGYQRTITKALQNSSQATIPTAENLAGNFSLTDGDPNTAGSNLCTSSHNPIQLYDPITGAKLQGNKYASAPTLNPQAAKLQKYFPALDPAFDTNHCGFVRYSIPNVVYDNQLVTKVDYTLSSKHNLSGRYLIDDYHFPAYFSPTNILVTTQVGNPTERVQTFTVADAYVIKSNIVNSAHISILRRRIERGYSSDAINATMLGINLYQTAPHGLYINASKWVVGNNTASLAHFNDNAAAVDDDVTWVHGRHQIVFGGEWVQNQLNVNNVFQGNGIFSFNGAYSANGPGGGSGGGDSNLDFLMGTLSSFQQSRPQQLALRGPIPSMYFQDTFHAISRLTVIGGLRYGPNVMPHDYFNRGAVFSQANFLANRLSTVYPNAPAGILFYGDPGVSRQFTKNSWLQLAPNIGASFDPFGNGKTVIRAGGALMFDNPNFFTAQRNQQNPPFATSVANSQTSSSGPLNFSAPWSVGAYNTNPFPQPANPSPSQALFFPQSNWVVLPGHFRPQYTIQWTLSVQRDLGRGWQATLDYIGNGSRHVPMGLSFNPAVFIPGVWGANGTGCTGIVTTGPAAVKPGAAGTNCSTVGNQASRFLLTTQNPAATNSAMNPIGGNQYQGGGAGTVLVSDGGTANYNGLIASIQHRLSSTFSLLGNWTWSKCLNIEDSVGDPANTSVENVNNPAMDYGPCGSDFRHIENVVLIAKSNFTGHLGRTERLLVNGWELAPLIHIQSGAPFTVVSGQDNSLTAIGNDRPNLVAGVKPYAEVKFHSAAGTANRQYLNPAAFAQVTAPCGSNLNGCAFLGTYGNIKKNSFRGPKSLQFDAQISRIFQIRENLSTTLRLEAFNVLNHPNFGGPTTSLTSSTFGQVSSASAARLFQGSVKINF